MFSEHDRLWSGERYPELITSADKVDGTISIRAAFDRATNKFQIIYPGEANVVGGCELAGSFTVSMRARTSVVPRIPALSIDGYPHDRNRHIDRDGLACLCSPFVESEYLSPELNARRFIEELVIPFLYGQLFYNQHSAWPWFDYSHGFAGLMESYTPVQSKDELLKRWQFFTDYPSDYRRVRRLISQRKPPSFSSPCICGSPRRIGHCHKLALTGILALRVDEKKFGT